MKQKLLLVFAFLSVTFAFAQGSFTSNEIKYNITSPTTVEVTEKSPVYSGSVEIPSTVTDLTTNTTYNVTAIGNEAFIECSSLANITIPNSVTAIGIAAFYDCNSLTNITIPNSVTAIGNEAFYVCTSLTNVTIAVVDPSTITLGGTDIFTGAPVSVLTVPSGSVAAYQAIAQWNSFSTIQAPFVQTSFTSGEISYNTTSPTTVEVTPKNPVYSGSVEIPSTVTDATTNTTYNVTAIGNEAFAFCSLTNITIPNSVTTIGDSAFRNCSSLTNITIPNSVTAIENQAFDSCSSLANITIPNSVTAIGHYAFAYCSSLTNITIPNSVTAIEDYAFFNCTNLTNVTIAVVDPSTITLGSDLFTGDTNIFTGVPVSVLTVPSGTVAAYKAIAPWNSFITIQEETITWTGNSGNDWNTATNWSTSTVPSTDANITIPLESSNYPTANNAISFKSLTIEDGATFIPKSTVSGKIIYKQNISDTNWHLISSPVSGDTYDNLITNNNFATGSGTNIGLSGYYDSSWVYAELGTEGKMISGMGLSVKLATAGELTYTGTALNTSNVIYGVSTGTRTNFNLLGNPFTAYVNFGTFVTINTGVLTEETIWVWNGTGYETHNSVNPIEIAPGQAFFVDASTDGAIIFTTANRSHQNTDTFKREAPKTSFELFVENETSKKSTKVFYIADKTTGFDNGYDSKMFSDTKSNFDVFTELISDNKGNKLAIQTLPNTDLEAIVVPVGITAKAGEEVTFSVNSQNFPSDIKIYLEDRIANTFTDISETNHKVIVENTAKNSGQFYIHTTSKNLEIAPIQPELQNISIYKSANNSITISGLQTDNASLNVFSVLGQKIISTSFKSTGSSIIQLPKTSKGVYIIELNSDLGTINKKIILE